MPAGSAVRDVTDDTFASEVLTESSKRPVVVDFWAPWCGPCRVLGPIIERVAAEYGGSVVLAKLNTDENPAVPSKFGIRSIPTLLIFKDGELKGSIVGFRPKSELKKRLDEALV
ncbi:thioredoxin [bacterium]|nr:MAG: thioredoxin [bacterium]